MYSGDSAFVWVNVKVTDRVVDELTPLVVTVIKSVKIATYRCGVFVEKHCESRKSGYCQGGFLNSDQKLYSNQS